VFPLTKENYERTLSDYRFWMEIGATHGWISDDQLYHDILATMKPVDRSSGQLVDNTSNLLLQFVTDVELVPALSPYASGVHGRLCHEILKTFFDNNLYLMAVDIVPGSRRDVDKVCKFYADVNFIAHWVNLGYLDVEDIQNRILQSLISQPAVHAHQLNSLGILFKIAGATFAAYVEPSLMDRCCGALESADLEDNWVATELVKVRALILIVKEVYER
jgi:hypothetical protein